MNKIFINIFKYKRIKSLLDIYFAAIFLIFLSPIFLIISLAIFFSMGRPIFFIQKRIGYHGEIFNLIKFRSMHNQIIKNEVILSENKRISKLGNFLRITSLDEIPELINILKGEMSFIGPRPLLTEYLALYNEEQMKRHNVKPGLSGWAQLNGRNTINWAKKFDLDLWYVKNINFFLDLKIFFLTFLYLLNIKKVNYKKGLSMPPFKGNQ
tara:strand:+ start:8279 stop:8908 length:630 start_codon:yes stop_codon:yes gene_type:complete